MLEEDVLHSAKQLSHANEHSQLPYEPVSSCPKFIEKNLSLFMFC